jgi:hypothetical protein
VIPKAQESVSSLSTIINLALPFSSNSSLNIDAICFISYPLLFVRPLELPTPAPMTSALTQMFEENRNHAKSHQNIAGKLKLTIYLPDYSSMIVYAKDTIKCSELLKLILEDHQDQDIEPPLDYARPATYELRMHEGDGEPDRDFPALVLDKRLSDYNLDEFCLCELETRANNTASRKLTGSVGEATFSYSQFGSIPVISSNISGHMNSRSERPISPDAFFETNPSVSMGASMFDRDYDYYNSPDQDKVNASLIFLIFFISITIYLFICHRNRW